MVSPKSRALELQGRGFAILPLHSIDPNGCCSCGQEGCASPAKHPWLRHGLKEASADPADARVWWTRWPAANIGVRTGEVSGIWVLDIDPRNGGDDDLADLELEHGELPPTLQVATGGGGRHYYFKAPAGGMSCGKLTAGIDIKGEGGYVVAPPSNHESGGSYQWVDREADILPAPDWLLIRPKQVAVAIEPLGLDQAQEEPEKAREIRAALEPVPADDRDEWLYVGMALHSAIGELGGAVAFNLWTEWSKRSPKYDPADQARVWASFDDAGGVTLSTLFAVAKKYGVRVQARREFMPGQVDGQLEERQLPSVDEVELATLEAEGVVEMPDLLLNPRGILGQLVDWMDETAIRPQRPFSVASALTVAGTILGRRYATETDLRANLYLVSVGPTGCGKNHARSAAKKVLVACGLEDRLGGEELASGQAILSRVAKHPAVLFQLDEFGLLMQAIQNPNAGSHLVAILSTLMKLFSSAADTFIGTEYADQEKRPRVEIECPSVSIYGTTTPETFYQALGSGHVVSGYLNRLLVVETSVNRPRRQKARNTPVPAPVLEWAAKAGEASAAGGNLVGLNPKEPTVVPMSTGAAELFDAFDLEIDAMMERDRGTGLDALHNRAWEHAAKIALVVALCRGLDYPTIRAEDAEWAITFVKWCQTRMIHEVSTRVADSPFQAKVKECLVALVRAGERGLTVREMGRTAVWARLTLRERSAVLEALEVAGQATEVRIPTQGRPRVAWVATR